MVGGGVWPPRLRSCGRLDAEPRHDAGDVPRVAVIIPCHGEGRLIAEAVASIQEPEPVHVVVVDDKSDDEETRRTLDEVEAAGTTVIRLTENRGVGRARMSALAVTRCRYVAPLDADDLAEPGALSAMADRLDADPEAVACVGDILEFGDSEIVRAVPETLDPYRVAYTNEYPVTALFRRDALEEVGGWYRAWTAQQGYEDWNLWMDFAERRRRIVHLGPGRIGYRRRLHGSRLNAEAKRRHAEIYHAMREDHPELFGSLAEHRRRSTLSRTRRLLYPVIYGARAEVPFERRIKPWLDRLGIWTLTRRRSDA
jgi:glycosyltransferase involved in cell wall biosynthesis